MYVFDCVCFLMNRKVDNELRIRCFAEVSKTSHTSPEGNLSVYKCNVAR